MRVTPQMGVLQQPVRDQSSVNNICTVNVVNFCTIDQICQLIQKPKSCLYSTRCVVALTLAIAYFAAVYLGDNLKLKMLMERIYLVSKRFFGVPTFFNYAIADGLYNLLFPEKTGIKEVPTAKKPDFQFSFNFWEE